MRNLAFRTLLMVLGTAALLGAAAYAQETKSGKLVLTVSPGHAYLFIDGQGQAPGDRSIELSAGTHKVLVANYGYRFVEKEVNIEAGQSTPLVVNLEREGDVVFGPKGRIQLEVGQLDAGDDAVLLNGKSPSYFVGHVDEFNNELFAHQELVVPPGNHLVTITRRGNEVWSGVVSVAENERVIVNIENGRTRTKDWERGETLSSVGRFKPGVVNTTVAVAPVSSAVTANPAKIECGQISQLRWNSKETIDADMSGMSPVPVNGVREVSPKQTTTYELTATGPGGVTKSSATVEVIPTIESTLTASTEEVRYRRIGDKVVEKGDVTLNWSTSNADSASLAPYGRVDTTGSRHMEVTPAHAGNGPVDETVNYTLSASNGCGGSVMKTVAVHVKGSIEATPEVLLNSIFYPTDYPVKANASLGLVRSQQESLTVLAAGFKKYLEYDPDAKLSLAGHADERGPNEYNKALSDRRVQRVREFLIAAGIPESKIETAAFGEEKPLDKATVIDLQTKNPNQPPETRVKNFPATWLAYNRRVDVILLPTNAESLRFYPNQAPDSEILWQRGKVEESVIEKNQ